MASICFTYSGSLLKLERHVTSRQVTSGVTWWRVRFVAAVIVVVVAEIS